ncbi:hypothetical protein [Lacrimispora brassicae]
MAVRTLKGRKIICDGVNYVWYVKEDDDFPCYVLHVISEDKKLILSHPLDRKVSYVISKGEFFQNYDSDGCWARYLYPVPSAGTVTPKLVSEIIKWAIYEKNAVRIQWDGKDICL